MFNKEVMDEFNIEWHLYVKKMSSLFPNPPQVTFDSKLIATSCK